MKIPKRGMGQNERISFLFFQLLDKWTTIYLRKNKEMKENGSSDKDILVLATKFASFCSSVDDDFKCYHGRFDVIKASKNFRKVIAV